MQACVGPWGLSQVCTGEHRCGARTSGRPAKGQRKGGSELVAQGPWKDLASARGNGSCGTREPSCSRSSEGWGGWASRTLVDPPLSARAPPPHGSPRSPHPSGGQGGRAWGLLPSEKQGWKAPGPRYHERHLWLNNSGSMPPGDKGPDTQVVHSTPNLYHFYSPSFPITACFSN